MTTESEYQEAKTTIATIKAWKEQHKGLLLMQIASEEGKAMWLSAKDVESAIEGLDEDIDELCWQSKCEALRAIQDYETTERLQHEYNESTHYSSYEQSHA